MTELVSSVGQIIDNVGTLYQYGESANENERGFHDKRVKNGKLFVAIQIGGRFHYAPSKFAGYVANDTSHADDLGERDGRKTNVALTSLLGNPLEPGDEGYDKIDRHFLDYCRVKGIKPSQHHRERRYWVSYERSDCFLADEIDTDDYWEGTAKTIRINRYERSNAAKERCLRQYGYSCSACGLRLEDVYGTIAKELIHVHHIVPLSEIGKGYKVDPVNDLRPVCPNCHAVIHRRKVPLTIEQVKTLLGR